MAMCDVKNGYVDGKSDEKQPCVNLFSGEYGNKEYVSILPQKWYDLLVSFGYKRGTHAHIAWAHVIKRQVGIFGDSE